MNAQKTKYSGLFLLYIYFLDVLLNEPLSTVGYFFCIFTFWTSYLMNAQKTKYSGLC